jgi:hypothetical protein
MCICILVVCFVDAWWCGFYEWQKDFLKMLVLRGTIVMHLEVVEEALDDLIEEVNSVGNACSFDEAVLASTLGPLHWKGR